MPDEPTARATAWLAAVVDGADLGDVLEADDGLIAWLWSRWSTLGRAGLTRGDFAGIVLDYRRELWLWLAGERTWAQSCSGLVGRIDRRLTPLDVAGR
ncbi:MAG: hypothetical protein ACLPVF_16250 [Acidimicrobiales bacterium]